MRKFAIAGIAALVIAGTTGVYAQHEWFRGHMGHHHVRMSPEDRAAMADAKIAAVHAGLKLTADQEKLWPPVESAVRDLVKARIDHAKEREKAREAAAAANDGDQAAKPDPVTRLRNRADRMAATAAALKKIADAADPLYKTLDDGQKRRLAMLTHHHDHDGEGWRERFEHRFGGDRDRGQDSERL
ncbi:Spy/CpxP family protein refolding chaperone [Bradyrhizobium sp.]|uniref:Spy/CpxP family protein refolding chaperone n=1 Tax=Bradyrhizobium sp. TaxID=376 RepID=UPI0026196180|nr:Spy/CpxP family protein refolding chaperone [Bradyrhizobium sp.]